MKLYICPECGTEMKESPIDAEVVRIAPKWEVRINLCCPKCRFSIMKNHYDFLYDFGKYGAAKLPPKEKDKGKREMSVPEMIFRAKNGDKTPEDAYIPEHVFEKPPLGCAPYYVVYEQWIKNLTEAISRNSAEWSKTKLNDWMIELNGLIVFMRELKKNLEEDGK